MSEIGVDGQLKIKLSRVLIVGAGGLGCPVLQYLNAAGVGNIGIIDFDNVDKTNLHRQILYGYSSIGKNKATEAQKRLNENNPFTKIDAFEVALTSENAIDLVSPYDIIVDCTDNFESRYIINDACILLNKPIVYGAIFKFEGHVSVFNHNNGPSYRCLYPSIPQRNSLMNCSEVGVLGVLPAIIGSMQANEVLKLILNLGDVMSGTLLTYNGLTSEVSKFNFEKSDHTIYAKINERQKLDLSDYVIGCNENVARVKGIELSEFKLLIKDEDVQLVDVREVGEEPIISNIKSIKIPSGEILKRLNEIDSTKKTIVFCQSGIRSTKVVQMLQEEFGYQNLHNLSNGIMAFYIESSQSKLIKQL